MNKFIDTCCLFFLSSLCAFAQPGTLDLTFSSDGKVTTGIGLSAGLDYGRSVAIQADGKIVVAGSSDDANNNYYFTVTRYLPNGNLDMSFSGDGIVTTNFSSSNDEAFAVAIQADGKIVVAGYCGVSGGTDFALVRYNDDGSLDATFDGDGKVTTSVSASNVDQIRTIAIQADGSIVVAGGSHNGGSTTDCVIARYNTNGSLDGNFGTGGVVITPLSGFFDEIFSIAIQPNGQIVAGGYSWTGTSDASALIRYNADGTLDMGFGSSGKVISSLSVSSDNINAVAIQPDGKIVAAGRTKPGSNMDVAVMRYNTDGSFDNSFDADGKMLIDVAGSNDMAYGMAIGADGGIIVTGSTLVGSYTDILVIAINAYGVPDCFYSNGGQIITNIDSNDDLGYAVAIQNDGKIVVAGHSLLSTDREFTVVRYNQGGCYMTVYDSITVMDTTHFAVTDTTHITITDTNYVLISVTDTLIIDAVLTGVIPPNNINTLKIYPNPARTHVVINFGNFATMSGYQVKVLNSLGQTVYLAPVTQQQETVNLSGWSGPGIYIVQVLDAGSNTVSTRTIVLQ